MNRRLLSILICLLSWIPGLQAQNSDDTLVGPWITNVTDSTATVLWTCNNSCLGWVEMPDGSRVYDTFAGRRVFDRLHNVTIRYSTRELTYRIGGQILLDDTDARLPVFGDVWNGDWKTVKLFDAADSDTRFSVFNDIHMNVEAYRNLCSGMDVENTDFIFLDGDIISADNYTLDRFLEYEIAPLGDLAQSLPLFFARGNHEGRGNSIKMVLSVYPNSGPGAFYYCFRQGPAAFVVLDAGETGESRSMLFSGEPVYSDYMTEQIAWARKALFEPSFASAPLKICLIHVPMIDHENLDYYKTQRWMNRNFLPLLNQAGIDVMIGADLHEHMMCLPGTMGNDFPIIVNDNLYRLDFQAGNGQMTIRTFDDSGVQQSEYEFGYPEHKIEWTEPGDAYTVAKAIADEILPRTLYVGTYGDAIHVMSYDPVTGEISGGETIPARNASYLALGDDALYAVSECGDGSGVYSFAKTDGTWTQTAFLAKTGADPCHIYFDGESGLVFTADYSGGSFSVFSTTDGVIEDLVQQEAFEGSNIHQIKKLDDYFLISDLGKDRILVNRLGDGKLENIGVIPCGEGSGPRHMEFNPGAGMLYCLTEKSGEVISWQIGCEKEIPSFTQVQRLKADGFDAHGSADIHLHPCGKWLYTSHRLYGDGISVMSVDGSGRLEKVGYTPTADHPRAFCFSPDGKRLLVACRDSHSIQVYDIDSQTGLLSKEFKDFPIGDDKPVCLVFD